jgi:hypothetical protein
MIRSVAWHIEGQALQVATVGKMYAGRRVLAISGNDPVTVVQDYVSFTISCGSIVRVEMAEQLRDPAVLMNAT